MIEPNKELQGFWNRVQDGEQTKQKYYESNETYQKVMNKVVLLDNKRLQRFIDYMDSLLNEQDN